MAITPEENKKELEKKVEEMERIRNSLKIVLGKLETVEKFFKNKNK